jgi:hypothetical protein
MELLHNTRPRLIEPGVKYFLSASLEQCHLIKTKYYNFLYNLGLLLTFAIIVGVTLYLKYKRKNDKLLQQQIHAQEKEYILNKLRFMQDYRKSQENVHLLTDLSSWQNNPEIQMYDRKILR